MRWLRTAATTVSSLAAAVLVIWTAIAWLATPRIVEYTQEVIESATLDLRREVQETSSQLSRMDTVVERLEENITRLSEAVAQNTAPSWRFSPPDTFISDGRIGGTVQITAGGFKLRECGIPRVDLYFVNGGGVYHRFIDASVLTAGNRGIAFPVDPDRVQTVRYTATIPEDDNVTPGRANGFISVTYPDGCPSVEEVVAGPLQFRITR